MSKKAYAVIPVIGHETGNLVPFKDGAAFDEWFAAHSPKISNWAGLQDTRNAKTLIVFFHNEADAIEVSKTAQPRKLS
ncbi:hypothetical protein ABIC83_002849 [Roseateles asaccharophilus]|uniref:hypothetical protein n=1 Tax=Roseateles asaccharophilus TaxID=582607 RepID=UPI00383493CB